MINQEGYDRDKQILEDWKDELPKGEYINRLYDLYKDYGLIHVVKTDSKKRVELCPLSI